MESLSPKLNYPEIVCVVDQLVPPEIVKKWRDVFVKVGDVGISEPAVDKLAVGVRSRVECAVEKLALDTTVERDTYKFVLFRL